MTRKIIHAIVLNADEYDEGLTFNEVSCDDVTHAFFDCKTDKCVYADDTYHSSPYEFFEGLCAGLSLVGEEVEEVEALIVLNDNEDVYSFIDICSGIRRWMKEESGNG
jgi:hypothetical protein